MQCAQVSQSKDVKNPRPVQGITIFECSDKQYSLPKIPSLSGIDDQKHNREGCLLAPNSYVHTYWDC